MIIRMRFLDAGFAVDYNELVDHPSPLLAVLLHSAAEDSPKYLTIEDSECLQDLL